MTKRKLGAVAAATALLAVACGAGSAGKLARPDEHKASDVLGKNGNCSAVGEEPQLLTLDWEDTLRSELETAMAKHIVVVHYGCDGVKVLRDCEVPGEYEFAGFSKAQTEARLDDEDQLKVNLPMGAASFNAEVQRGSTIDLTYVAVGQQSTTVHGVPRSKLKGTCDGATHTVRSANIGAFALATGTKGAANAAAALLGKTAAAESSSTQKIKRVNGALDACNAASESAKAPTDSCRALVQLLLSPISDGAAYASASANKKGGGDDEHKDWSTKPIKNPCQEGFVLDKNGMCARPEKAAAYLCDVAKIDECKTQCDKGEGKSCFNAAANQLDSKLNPNAKYEERKTAAFGFLEKSCNAGYAPGCGQLAYAYDYGYGVKTDDAKAESLFHKACSMGDALSCRLLASNFRNGSNGFKKDESQAFELFSRACQLGNNDSCTEAARQLEEGVGTTKDLDAAGTLLQKSCDAGNDWNCSKAAELKRKRTALAKAGEQVKLKDLHTRWRSGPIDAVCEQGLRLNDKNVCAKPDASSTFLCEVSALDECKAQCDKGDGRSCYQAAANRLGKWNAASRSGNEDALAFLEKGCAASSAMSCGELGYAQLYGYGAVRNADKAEASFRKACTGGDWLSCKELGRLYQNGNDGFKKTPATALEFHKKACDLGNGDSCTAAADMLLKGDGLPKDEKTALQILDKSCSDGFSWSCSRAKSVRADKEKPVKKPPAKKK
jgi:TPR repeat protein